MTRYLSIIGSRPQYMKVLDNLPDHVIVDTRQHYDQDMSEIFIKELKLKPKYNLNTQLLGEMIDKSTEAIEKEDPDIVIVYGDTRSTLAGAIAAKMSNKTLVHIEAGMRSHDNTQPEEVIRVTVDGLADYLFCANSYAKANLAKELISHNVHVVGDPLWDSLNRVLPMPATSDKGMYDLLTIHRAQNADNPTALKSIIEAVGKYGFTTIFPCHPRTKRMLKKFKIKIPKNIQLIKPLSYRDMIKYEANARKIITDSGGVQREAYWFGIPCIILRWETEWLEIVEDGWGVLVGTSQEKILQALKEHSPTLAKNKRMHMPTYGAKEQIKTILEK